MILEGSDIGNRGSIPDDDSGSHLGKRLSLHGEGHELISIENRKTPS